MCGGLIAVTCVPTCCGRNPGQHGQAWEGTGSPGEIMKPVLASGGTRRA